MCFFCGYAQLRNFCWSSGKLQIITLNNDEFCKKKQMLDVHFVICNKEVNFIICVIIIGQGCQ